MTKELKQQFTLRITQANKTELIVILYDMILAYVDDAKEAHTEQNRAAFHDAIRKIRGCNQELIASLNLEYEPAMNLLSLYIYVNRELVHADVRNDIEPLEHVVKVISGLKEAYEIVASQDTSGAVMQNAQTIYAGLTYGKGDLTENMADQGLNRGFLA